MRIRPRQLAKIIRDHKGSEDELRELLRYIFSFRENIDTYSKFCFPHVIKGVIPGFHREIYSTLTNQRNEALAAPRGTAKSTTAGVVFVSWCVVNQYEKYIVYISQNHVKTVKFIEPLKDEFEGNARLRWLYGDLTPSAAQNKKGKDREDCFDVGKVRIEALSFEKNIRGMKWGHHRPTLIILDDVEDDNRVMNPELRMKDLAKINKQIIPAMDLEVGKYKFIGTILSPMSALKKKIDQRGGKIYRIELEDGTLLWPGRFTKERLRDIKKEIGTLAYQQEMMNNPSENEASIIKAKHIRACFNPTLSFEDLQDRKFLASCGRKAQGVDFAFSDAATADESAFISVASKDDLFYIFHCAKKRGMSVLDQIIQIEKVYHRRWNYDIIALEENSIRSVTKNVQALGLPIKMFWTAGNDPAKKRKGEKEYPEKRTTVGKFGMIQRLGALFEAQRIVIPYKTPEDQAIADRILDECTSYALVNGKLTEAGVHPDIPIGLGYAIEAIGTQRSSFFFD